MAESQAFVAVYPEDFTFLKHVRLMRDARFVVAPEGAALFQAQFAPENVRLGILCPQLVERPTIYVSVFMGMSANIAVLTGPIVRE